MSGLEFTDENALRLESLYMTSDVVSQRDATLKHAKLSGGDSVLDVGSGPGVPIERTVRGGVCGLVFDGRGRRPLPVPLDAAARVKAAETWGRELDLYPSL